MKTLGQYSIKYHNGITQVLDLISHEDFVNIIQVAKDEIYNLLNHPDNKKPKTKEYHTKKASAIKQELTDTFGDNYFTTGSPLYFAFKTGILLLPETQGGYKTCVVVKINEWIKSEEELPRIGSNVEISDDGINVIETANYSENRKCMLAGVGGGNGYFGKGFCTDGSTGCDAGLILDTPLFWRYK